MTSITGTMAFAVTLASVTTLTSCQSGDSDPGGDPRAEQTETSAAAEISERISGYLGALERGDAEAAVDYWTEDAALVGPGIELDRSSVLAGMRSVFDAGTRVDILDRRTIEMFVHGDAAYEIAQAEEVFIGRRATSADTVRNNMFVRWEKGPDGNWRFDRVLLGPQASGAQ